MSDVNIGSLDYGFDGSIPQSEEDERQALSSGLLSLDANVLLNFYRYSPNAQSALVDVLHAAGDRVWVSHQAAKEFWRNRCAAIDGRAAATEQLRESLDDGERRANQSIDAWAKQTAVPEEIQKQVSERMSVGFAEVRELVDGEIQGTGRVAYDSTKDTVLTTLRDLLANRIGPQLDPDDQADALREATRRLEERVPPGFRDVEKEELGGPDGAAGDYLVWYQSLLEAKRRDLPLVVVTGDEKDDWWWKHRGIFMGPRPELVWEFTQQSKHRLFMLRPVQLIRHASVLDVTVSEDAASDVERASAEAGPPQWTAEAVAELLLRLDAEAPVQAEVIRFAAASGGSIGRDKIYEIGEYGEDRMLRGFTRPTGRITRDLQAEGLLEVGVDPMLTPVYLGVTAEKFEIPSEVVDLLGSRSPA